jgi:hypothetical protein
MPRAYVEDAAGLRRRCRWLTSKMIRPLADDAAGLREKVRCDVAHFPSCRPG